MERISIINEIKERKIEQRNPDISDIVDKYPLTEKEAYAVDEFNRRIDNYMEIHEGVKPDESGLKYVSSTDTFQKAMKIATVVPIVAGGAYALRKHILKAAAFTFATAALSRAAERRFGTITRYLQTHGPLSLCARMGVYNSEKQLSRVIEREQRLRN